MSFTMLPEQGMDEKKKKKILATKMNMCILSSYSTLKPHYQKEILHLH